MAVFDNKSHPPYNNSLSFLLADTIENQMFVYQQTYKGINIKCSPDPKSINVGKGITVDNNFEYSH